MLNMSEKYEQLVTSALELFYQNSVNSIGINEVLKTAGVAKRTLYNHFSSKEELVVAALEKRHKVYINWLEQSLVNANTDEEVILSLFNALSSWFDGSASGLGEFKGCFFINTAAEFGNKGGDIFKLCVSHKEAVKARIQKQLSEKNKSLTETIFLIQEGAIVTAVMTENHNNLIQLCKSNLLSQLK